MNLKKEMWQFIKFGLVGIGNTVISYAIYVICVYFRVHYLLGSILGFIVSVSNSFYWNNKFVFIKKQDEKRNIWGALIKTYISYAGTGILLTSILLIIWVDGLGISEYVAPIINLLITIPLNFIINKKWAFKN